MFAAKALLFIRLLIIREQLQQCIDILVPQYIIGRSAGNSEKNGILVSIRVSISSRSQPVRELHDDEDSIR